MKIAALGDAHTVSALQLAGVEATVADSSSVCDKLRDVLGRQDVGLIIITRELAEALPPELRAAGRERSVPVIVEIPGMADSRGFAGSALAGIAQALGLPM